ncbi:MAG: FAD-dependent oxidoreductase [Candidatus Woesearchaeota archaeon]
MDKKKVVIIGGGITGLSTAVNLLDSQEDLSITILEKKSYFGGLAASFDHKGNKIPVFYHHVFSHDDVTHKYLKRFGLFEDMVWKRIKMAIVADGKVYNFTDIFSLLKFDYLSFWGRIRYGLFGAFVFTVMRPETIPENLDAEVWLRSYAGDEVTEKLFGNLYSRNKYNIPLTALNAKQFAYRLKAREAIGVFGYPRMGLHRLIEAFEEELKGMVRTIKNCKVEEIDLINKKICFDGRMESFDILVNTIPLPEFLRVASGLSKTEIERWKNIKYCPVVSVVVGFKDLLSDHYWLNIFQEEVHMVVQHSWLFDGYPEKIVWLGRYGASEEDFPLRDAEITAKYIGVIKKYFPKAKPMWTKVFKERYAEPIYNKDYAKNKPGYKTSIKGVYNAGVAVTYPKIRNMNTALCSGEEVAKMILADIQ